jgi:Fe2+ transport system protein FeoA
MSLARRNPSSCTRSMANSEPATQEWTLASVPRGDVVEVRDIMAEDPEALLVHGIRPGARLVVDGDAPFGGPRMIRLGGCRVAIDRRLARTIRVARVARHDPDAGPTDRL